MLEALGYRLEKSCLGFVEPLLVDSAHAHDAAGISSAEGGADQRAGRGREQVDAYLAARRRAYDVETTVITEAVCLVRPQPVGAHDTRASVAPHEDEGDLGLEHLAELRRHETAEFSLGASPVHDRDDLRASRRLDEAPKELVAGVSTNR
jgi:hypothetical protein